MHVLLAAGTTSASFAAILMGGLCSTQVHPEDGGGRISPITAPVAAVAGLTRHPSILLRRQTELFPKVDINRLVGNMKGLSPNHPWVPHLTPSQLAEIHHAFSKFDRDGNGHIETKELMHVLRVMGLPQNETSSKQVTDMIEAVDKNGNGKVELDEFVTLMARRMVEHDGATELELAFSLFDADNSGVVTTDEIRSIMTTIGAASGQALTHQEVEELIQLADPDANGNITLAEFKAMECWKLPEFLEAKQTHVL